MRGPRLGNLIANAAAAATAKPCFQTPANQAQRWGLDCAIRRRS